MFRVTSLEPDCFRIWRPTYGRSSRALYSTPARGVAPGQAADRSVNPPEEGRRLLFHYLSFEKIKTGSTRRECLPGDSR